MKGIVLENLAWPEAERILTAETVIVIPLGAAAKEHGPHLQLNNDWLIAEYLKQQVVERSDVVVAPTVNCHYYPAFAEYPGSISLRLETARDLIVDMCQSLARYGPRRFYVLNTGVSTIEPLQRAAKLLSRDGVLLHYTDIVETCKQVETQIGEQEGGTHADEMETSMMLYIAPDTVDMERAKKDYHPSPEGGLTRHPKGRGSYSPTGIFGDPALATREKGEKMVKTLTERILSDIEALRASSE